MDVNFYPPPVPARDYLLEDARRRDLVTARRKLMLEFLWRERYLTREGLLQRVEAVLGRFCFGEAAWVDTFYRDIRVVKDAFKAAGYELAFSRRPGQTGYYLKGQPPLSTEIATALRSCAEEVDPIQTSIFQKMSTAERFRLGFSISDAARSVSRTIRSRN